MTKPWYEAAFGADYLERYAHRDQQEANRTAATLLARLPLRRDGAVLDLCCGAGRHVLALHAMGFRVVGLDLSMDLLQAGQEAFRTNGAQEGSNRAGEPLFVRGDKRRLPFRRAAFDLVTHFFTAFGYFARDEENFGVFGEVSRVLAPGGWYLFDFLSAPMVLEELRDRDADEQVEVFADGSRVETIKHLADGGRRVEKRMRFYHGEQFRKELTESVRLFTPSELRNALARAGLRVEQEWGDYEAGDYSEMKSPRWIALARRGE